MEFQITIQLDYGVGELNQDLIKNPREARAMIAIIIRPTLNADMIDI